MKKPRYANLKIDATLELEPRDLAYLDDEEMEDLMRKVYEISETFVRVKLQMGTRIYRGHIRFSTPIPPALKEARLKFLGKE